MNTVTEPKRSTFYGVWLLLASFLGLGAAFALTLDKLKALVEPDVAASCDFSVIVQCSTNLASAQGALFGFPNPLIGLMAWPFVLVTAVLVLAKVKLPKFYWAGFLAGTTGALVFVIWLMSQSIYVLGTLCPWCMVTWVAVIPTFLATLAHSGANGVFGAKAVAFFTKAKSYVPTVAILAFATIAFLAQLRLDWIATL